jgi:AraC-like DNA-binding protein
MSDAAAEPGARRAAAAEAFAEWIRSRVPDPGHGSEGTLANELAVAIADPSVIRVSDLEVRLHASTRTLQRIAARFFGLSPHSMIRRRRLQEAAERLREDSGLPIARIATELGYADHAHFSSDFKALLGVTPSAYRESAGLAHDH